MMPNLLPSIPPSLSDELKRETIDQRSNIVKANCNSQFAQNTPELGDFRHAIAGRVNEMDDDSISELFLKTVHFTTYHSLAPFLAGLSERPYKASALLNLFAPGFPDTISESSSTSSTSAKLFFNYNALSQINRSSSARWHTISDPLRRRTKAFIRYGEYDRVNIMGEDPDSAPIATVYQGSWSVTFYRVQLGLHPEDDEEKMGTFIFDHAAPYATGFIANWRSFILIHALFSIGSRSIETFDAIFIPTFVDMMCQLDMEFDTIVDCIANGAIPDLEGISHVRHYLEMNISPDPERAAELRRLGRPFSQPGWCAQAWPNLRSVISVASGSFASSVPLARSFIGPNVEIRALGYAASESLIGVPYDPCVPNMFKVTDMTGSVFEFLDIGEADSIDSLVQLWEVQPGRRYEIVLTTEPGLWRYRLGDVIEVCGFDPTDGVPVIQFIQRRNMVLQFPDFMVTEEDLQVAMSSLTSITFVSWTAAMDERIMPPTIVFFLELAGDQEVYDSPHVMSDLTTARDNVINELKRSNENITWTLEQGIIRKPELLIVRRGTFSEFLQLKLNEGSRNIGQVKIPVALPRPKYMTWFMERVVHKV